MTPVQKSQHIFTQKYNKQPELTVYAPGRVNIIGEHTDYNGGFVFPGAIDKGMIAEIKPNGTDKVRAYSIDLLIIFGMFMRQILILRIPFLLMKISLKVSKNGRIMCVVS